jgi:hypothetical protein
MQIYLILIGLLAVIYGIFIGLIESPIVSLRSAVRVAGDRHCGCLGVR